MCYIYNSGQFDYFWDSRGSILKKEIDLMFQNSQKIIVPGKYWKQVVPDNYRIVLERSSLFRLPTRNALFKKLKIINEAANILFWGGSDQEKVFRSL